MRTIIAGSREGTDADLEEALMVYVAPKPISLVLCGMAIGIDAAGKRWAIRNNIPVEEYPADWKKHGKRAGPIRNKEMASKAEGLIAVWDGRSPGTANMIDEALAFGIRPWVYLYPAKERFWLKSRAQFRAMREAMAGKV